MKILLIKPYWRVPHQVIGPPMGLMSLASYVREKLTPRPEVFIFDQRADQKNLRELSDYILRLKPDVIGISALTYEAPAVKILSQALKKIVPEVPVLVGGPHATVFYDHILEKTQADIAVIGEGEATFLEFLQRHQEGRDWRDITGIAYRGENGKIVKNPPRPLIQDMDSLPYPAWDLINIPVYAKFGDMNNFLRAWPYMYLFSSRACPYGCIYCHRVFGKKFRARSAEATVEEIKILTRNFGIKEIQIIDDIFNWDLDRAKAICEGIIRENIKVNICFPNAVRGDRMDSELIQLLARAGCYSLTYAIESASPRIQKLIHKFADLDKINWAIEKTYDAGIIPMGFNMLGFPTETREEMEMTIQFSVRSKMLKATFFSVVPFPRTELFTLFKQTYPNDFKISEEDLDSMHFFPAEAFYKAVTGIDLGAVVRYAYRSFYLHPWRLTQIFTKFDWNRRLVRAMYHGIRAIWSGGDKFEQFISEQKRYWMWHKYAPPQN